MQNWNMLCFSTALYIGPLFMNLSRSYNTTMNIKALHTSIRVGNIIGLSLLKYMTNSNGINCSFNEICMKAHLCSPPNHFYIGLYLAQCQGPENGSSKSFSLAQTWGPQNRSTRTPDFHSESLYCGASLLISFNAKNKVACFLSSHTRRKGGVSLSKGNDKD